MESKYFVNRNQEINYLQQEYRQDYASLVIIYGRRRIGKTTLIKNFIEDKNALYFMATEEPERENKKNFQRLLGTFTGNELLKKNMDLQWDEIFSLLGNYAPGTRKVLVIDEFQHLGKSNKAFPSIFQRVWDQVLCRVNIMVILCGSLVSMMYAQTLSYASPLYGRRTGQIRMKQVAFKDYSLFFNKPDELNLIAYYSVTGGVPKYIELVEPLKDIFKSIERNILSKQSFLYEEPIFLLERELGEVGTYFSIIKSIAAGNHKLGKIAAELGIQQSGVTNYLNTLMDLDIIQRITPVTETNPQKSKKGLYVINDNFINFWFKFVYPYRNYLEMDNSTFVLNKLKQNFIDNHVSYVYEDICRERIVESSSKGDMAFTVAKIGKWWNKDNEIDIVALSPDSEQIMFAECKYTEQKMDADIYYKLKEKSTKVNYNPNARAFYVFFSKSGFSSTFQHLAEKDANIYLFNG